MQLTKIISTEVSSLGHRVAKFLRFGKSDTRTAEQAAPYGIDSNPIKDMIAVYGLTDTKGDAVIIGYLNKNAIASPGEFRIFSTDEDGTVKATIHLKNTGITQLTGDSWEIGGNAKNLARYQELETAFNSLKDTVNTMTVRWNAFVAAYVPGGPSVVGTPPTLAGQTVNAPTADITGAKADNVKTA